MSTGPSDPMKWGGGADIDFLSPTQTVSISINRTDREAKKKTQNDSSDCWQRVGNSAAEDFIKVLPNRHSITDSNSQSALTLNAF